MILFNLAPTMYQRPVLPLGVKINLRHVHKTRLILLPLFEIFRRRSLPYPGHQPDLSPILNTSSVNLRPKLFSESVIPETKLFLRVVKGKKFKILKIQVFLDSWFLYTLQLTKTWCSCVWFPHLISKRSSPFHLLAGARMVQLVTARPSVLELRYP